MIAARRRGALGGVIALLLAAALGAGGAPAAAASRPSAVILFVAAAPGQPGDAVEQALGSSSFPSLSLGILSATEGAYRTSQFLLDVGQGARIASSSYTCGLGPSLPAVRSGGRVVVAGWAAALRRANDAPAELEPGLLSASVPGGAGYAAVAGVAPTDAPAAARRDGTIAAFSDGPAATLPARVDALLTAHRLVLADLPAGGRGLVQLREVLARPRAGELVLVVQRAPNRPGNELLWLGAAGLGRRGELTSDTTNQRGLVSAVDLAPTILRHLGLPVPDAMNGRTMRVDGTLHPARLRSFADRLRAVYRRRLPTLLWLVLGWALLAVALAWSPRGRRAALRIGALAMLWVPVGVLITAALEPGRIAEKAILAGSCLVLGAVTDRLLRWPRGPIAPAVVAVVAIVVDALTGTQLLARSLLGPNPAYGARFFGIGNELKSCLVVLVLAAVAAALTPGRRSRRAAVSLAAAGAALAVVEGSARLGAGVGGVILVAAGTAVATMLALPGRFSRRRAVTILASPLVALVALAVLDLTTAHGTGHFNGTVLHAHSAGELRDVIVRRYGNAWGALRNGAMPEATALALVAAAAAVRWRRRILGPLADPIWEAALAGGLAAGVVGTLVEDSGPVLLVVAMFALACLVAYAQGAPRLAPGVMPGAGRRAMAAGPVGDGTLAEGPVADGPAAAGASPHIPSRPPAP